MTRKVPRLPRRKGKRGRWLDWKPSFLEVFSLAGRDWSPPAQVHLSAGARRCTLSAVFTRPDGSDVTCKARLLRHPDGQLDLVEEGLVFHFRTYGKGS